MLIPAGISAVGIALDMADQDRDITVKYILVHVNRIAAACQPQIHHVIRILAVMADNLPRGPELMKKLITENRPGIRFGTAGMEPVGDNKQDILLLNARAVKLIQDITDAQLSVAGGLLAAFYTVRHHESHSGSLMCQLR